MLFCSGFVAHYLRSKNYKVLESTPMIANKNNFADIASISQPHVSSLCICFRCGVGADGRRGLFLLG
jgi:hypothetical protein